MEIVDASICSFDEYTCAVRVYIYVCPGIDETNLTKARGERDADAGNHM